MRERVAGLISGLLLSARETVITATFALRATSFIVACLANVVDSCFVLAIGTRGGVGLGNVTGNVTGKAHRSQALVPHCTLFNDEIPEIEKIRSLAISPPATTCHQSAAHTTLCRSKPSIHDLLSSAERTACSSASGLNGFGRIVQTPFAINSRSFSGSTNPEIKTNGLSASTVAIRS